MTTALAHPDRPQSAREELANTLSHGVGLVAALIAVPVLVVAAVRHGGAVEIVSASVFAATIVLLYLTSTIYHALPRNRAKRVFRVLDHIAIFMLIAGTYTPFTLVVLGGAWGWTLFGMAWGFGLAGVALKLTCGPRFPILSTCLYLIMGWMALIAIKPFVVAMPPWGLFWIAAGGVAYTGGVVFYAADRIRFFHLGWHVCVLAGTTCHFIAVLVYAISGSSAT